MVGSGAWAYRAA